MVEEQAVRDEEGLEPERVEAILPLQPLGRRRAVAARDETIPAAHHAVQGDQPLADRERLAGVAIGVSNAAAPATHTVINTGCTDMPVSPAMVSAIGMMTRTVATFEMNCPSAAVRTNRMTAKPSIKQASTHTIRIGRETYEISGRSDKLLRISKTSPVIKRKM